MKFLILSKGTMLVTAGVAAVAVGGGAYAMTSSSHPSKLRSDSQHAPAVAQHVAPALAAPKNAVGKAAGTNKAAALPKAPAAAAKPAALPALPVLPGVTCPAAPSLAGLRSALTTPWNLSLTAQKDGTVQIQGHAYCEVTETWTNPAGKVLILRTVTQPAGVALAKVASVLGFPACSPISLGGVLALRTPVASAAGLVWVQRPGVVVALSGDALLPGAPMQALAGAVRQAG